MVGFALVLLGGLLLAGCNPGVRVGALQTESRSVELGDAKSVRVDITMGAGDLNVTGGAEKLLEADFSYNVSRLKPEVAFTNGTLVVRQPDATGMPNLLGITDFRNEWDLQLLDGVPMELKVDMGAGSSDLQLRGLSLTRLDVKLGAGDYTIDLSGDWARDVDVAIEAGAASVRLRLPRDIGARVEIESGPHTVTATGLTQDGAVYTNAAYGQSDATLQIDMEVGVGQIVLEVDQAATVSTS
jgi:hypothetical protein